MKKCTKCSELKQITEFYGRGDKKGKGIQSQCKTCCKLKQINYRKNNPSKSKDIDLYQRFGIRLDTYNKMFENQNGCCAICNRHQSEFKKALAVDHCHSSGQIRSLLCQGCNQGIGNFREQIDLLHGAINYLTFYKKV